MPPGALTAIGVCFSACAPSILTKPIHGKSSIGLKSLLPTLIAGHVENEGRGRFCCGRWPLPAWRREGTRCPGKLWRSPKNPSSRMGGRSTTMAGRIGWWAEKPEKSRPGQLPDISSPKR